MRQIRALLCLSWADRLLLTQAAALISVTQLRLWLLPFRAVHHRSMNSARPITQGRLARRPTVERVTWAVTTASHYLPSATCLVQALTTQVLLKRFGDVTQIRIGVRHDETGQFKAHAWVEHHGQIVIGGSAEEIALFTVLPSLD
jgi:hypothetical protein